MFATVERADEYHSARLTKDAWLALSEEQKAQALQSATDTLDLYASRKGGWKQDYKHHPPEGLQDACCMVALNLTDDATNNRLKLQEQGVSAVSIGNASESYGGANATRIRMAGISSSIEVLLRAFVRQNGSGAVIM